VRGGGSGFDEWRQRGGLYLKNIMSALPGMIDTDLDTSLFFLEVLQSMLVDRVDQRRSDEVSTLLYTTLISVLISVSCCSNSCHRLAAVVNTYHTTSIQ
jgi:hypothetical protein